MVIHSEARLLEKQEAIQQVVPVEEEEADEDIRSICTREEEKNSEKRYANSTTLLPLSFFPSSALLLFPPFSSASSASSASFSTSSLLLFPPFLNEIRNAHLQTKIPNDFALAVKQHFDSHRRHFAAASPETAESHLRYIQTRLTLARCSAAATATELCSIQSLAMRSQAKRKTTAE